MQINWPALGVIVMLLALWFSYRKYRETQCKSESGEFRQFLEKSYPVAEKLFKELSRFFDDEELDENVIMQLAEELSALAVVSLRWVAAKKRRAELVAEFDSLAKLAKRLVYADCKLFENLHRPGVYIAGVSSSERRSIEEKRDLEYQKAVDLILLTQNAANDYGIAARKGLLNL